MNHTLKLSFILMKMCPKGYRLLHAFVEFKLLRIPKMAVFPQWVQLIHWTVLLKPDITWQNAQFNTARQKPMGLSENLATHRCSCNFIGYNKPWPSCRKQDHKFGLASSITIYLVVERRQQRTCWVYVILTPGLLCGSNVNKHLLSYNFLRICLEIL